MSFPQFTSAENLTFSANLQEDVDRFSELTMAFLGFRKDIGSLLKQLLQDAPEMPMALCVKGYIAKMIVSASHSARAIGISQKLEAVITIHGVNDRERLHAKALDEWCKGELVRATECWEKILVDYPLDSLALRLAHYLHFYSGNAGNMRDSVARVLSSWSESQPNYGFVVGMYAFGLEESGEYDTAEIYGRKAVERNPADTWSVHAVAHVMEMTGRRAEGISWVNSLSDNWLSVNNFRYHLYWHLALFHLENGDTETVLQLYDTQVGSDITADFNLDMCNAASLLWRLEMYGVNVGERWQGLIETAENHITDHELVFVSLHYYLALLAANENRSSDRLYNSLKSWAAGTDTQSYVCMEVGMGLAKGIQLARSKKFAAAIEAINKCKKDMALIGGSHAQRNLFELVLADSGKKLGY
jgi:tetratricopeptide (TPR) repeat protein